MLKRHGVEIYFIAFAGFMLASLVLTLNAILEQREASWIAFVLLGLGCASGLMAMVAADVRQRALPTR